MAAVRGNLDTSVVIGTDAAHLPEEAAISAATARVHGVPLYTRNRQDFQPFAELIDIALVEGID